MRATYFGPWKGKRVCDYLAGYKASSEQGITEIGCMAHARRKFFDLYFANNSSWPSGRCARLPAQRQLVTEGSAIAKALDYSLKRWGALARYLDDGAVPIDNNWVKEPGPVSPPQRA